MTNKSVQGGRLLDVQDGDLSKAKLNAKYSLPAPHLPLVKTSVKRFFLRSQ